MLKFFSYLVSLRNIYHGSDKVIFVFYVLLIDNFNFVSLELSAV